MDSLYTEDNIEPTQKSPARRVWFFLCALATFTLIVFVLSISILNSPPQNFPTQSIHIPVGSSGSHIGILFKNEGFIRSEFLFTTLLQYSHPDAHIQAGTYYFASPLSTSELLQKLVVGEGLTPDVSVTFPEGFSTKNINEYLPDYLRRSLPSDIVAHEGYLFPDTYFLSSSATGEELVELMLATFTEKLAPYQDEIEKSIFSQHDVVILASILEREANDEESMRMVSAILQNRLRIQMALQVDAVFDYILGKESSELTEDDLALDSPFNTYTHTGLPPTPIANPGINAIEAVLNPYRTDYLYYLTGSDGKFYYAKTFEEHKRNKELYL